MMETVKSILLLAVGLAIIGVLGYWAVITIEPASVGMEKQKVADLTQQNSDLEKQVAELTVEVQTLKNAEPITQAESQPVTQPAKPAPTKPATTASKYQSLINDLQKLANSNVLLKQGSQGASVGTVQTFLNLYNHTSKKVDNDFGPGLKTDVMNFQKANAITQTGQVGSLTFNKMIDWLKKQ